jgi:hypothetical protein
MNEVYFYIYIIVTFLIAIYLILKNNPAHKFITFITAYWLLAGSVLNTEYFIIDIKGLPFDLQPPRIIFILFTIYLILVWVGKIKNIRVNTQEPKFERYLYIYVLLSIIVNVIHTIDLLTIKDIILNSTEILTFLVIYLVLKRTADSEMINVLGKALLIVCIFSSIIGIYQFLVNPLFFRLGSERVAFAGLLRSNGIFHAEYMQSYFLIPGIILTLFTVRRKLLKYGLIGLFLFGIIFTFHRMSWIITILLFTLYFIEVKKRKAWQMVAVGGIVVAIILLFYSNFSLNISEIKSSSFVQERLFADTVTGRIALYKGALKEIPEHWLLGVGGIHSDPFYWTILSAGGSEKVALGETGGAIHNEYILIGFLYGLPVLFFFCGFLILSLIYFFRKSKGKSKFFFIPTLFIVMFMAANISNMFSLSCDIGLLLAIYLGIGVAVYQKNIDVSRLVNERIYR